MINKEFHCATCGDFTSGISICPKCGGIAARVFRTPVGLSFGRAKSIDRVIEGEFQRRNISNYTNASGTPRVNYGSGEYNGVRAGWGKQQLSSIQQQYAPMMPQGPPPPTVEGRALSLPPGSSESRVIDAKNSEPWGKHVPSEIMDLKPNE